MLFVLFVLCVCVCVVCLLLFCFVLHLVLVKKHIFFISTFKSEQILCFECLSLSLFESLEQTCVCECVSVAAVMEQHEWEYFKTNVG